jgi:ABC-2 type transport system permease protein
MEKLKKTLLPITTFVPIDIKRLFRDKVGIFFVFLFPLIFLLIFGTIFGGDEEVNFNIGLINQSQTQFATEFEEQLKNNDIFRIDETVTDIDEARLKMNRSQIHATVILPDGFGEVTSQGYPAGEAHVLYDQNNESAARTLNSVLEGVFKEINTQLVPTDEPFTVTSESTASEGLRRFDYTFAGLLGFTLISLGIFGPTTVFPKLKQRGVTRRYQSTSLKVWQYFTANVISNSIVGLMSVALMYLVAVLVFGFNMRGDYLSFAIIVILGVILMFGIGLAVGGWAKNENQAAPLTQIIVFPMIFLSGVFFPTFVMPEFLQNISRFVPLTPVIDGIRLVATEGNTIFQIGPQLLVIGIWTVVIYAVAFRVFRWE